MSATEPAILRTETLEGGGVTQEVYAEGTGDFPPYGANVTAHYTGRLLDGSVFDSRWSGASPSSSSWAWAA